MMKVFVAGGSGAVGARLVPMLVREGHLVVALCRRAESAAAIAAAGATPVVADALDSKALRAALIEARPDAVVHQLTALAAMPGNLKRFDQEFATTNRLRTQALDTMIDAAREAGARRFIAQSFCGWPQARTGSLVKTEADALAPHPAAPFTESMAAIRHLESVVPQARGMVGIVLRYGALYGPGTGFAADGHLAQLVRKRALPVVGRGTGIWSFTHVDDAAGAAVRALTHGDVGIYNIVDDDPAPVHVWLPALANALGAKPPLRIPAWVARFALGKGGVDWMLDGRGSSNSKARRILGWTPSVTSWREGFRHIDDDRLSRT